MAKTATRTGGRNATTRRLKGRAVLAVGPAEGCPKPHWKWRLLSDVARMESGHTPSRKVPEYWEGEIPWVSVRDARIHNGGTISATLEQITSLGLENSSARLLPAGTICLSRTASIGYVVKAGCELTTSQGFVNWICSPELDPDFLAYLLKFEGKFIEGLATGSTHKTLYYPEVKAFYVCHPPLEEQKQIVAVLDQAFAALDRAHALAEANLADAGELFEVGLDHVIAKHGENASPTNLGAICTFENGDRGKNYPGRKAFVPSGVPFINAGHLEDGAIDWDAMNFIPEEHYQRLAKGKVRQNDLLFCLRGSLGKFGKVDQEGLGAIASSLVIVRAGEDVLTDFLSIYFRSKTCKLMIEKYGGGAAQPNLSAGDLKRFKIDLPSIAAQRRAIEEHDELSSAQSELVSSYRRQLGDLDDLRLSLLQKAFAGELT